MDTKCIFSFLRNVAANNNRPWFQEHKDEYLAAKETFEHGIGEAIARIATFDTEIAHVTVKDAVYRFYRDTRFSADKSPYKNHFGAYINAHGKKALRGGYYIHMEPEHCLLAIGNYWLPTNILTACRNEIMGNEAEWLRCVDNKAFRNYFGGTADAATWDEAWDQPQGFGLTRLKTCPTGFPKDYAHVNYLRLKDYCCWHHVSEDFFAQTDWLDQMEDIFRTGKPMMDFINSVVDDYE